MDRTSDAAEIGASTSDLRVFLKARLDDDTRAAACVLPGERPART